MWKRLNTSRSGNGTTARQSAISEPVLVETTIFEKSYGAAGGINVNMGMPSSNRYAPPPKPIRNNTPKGLPLLPFEAVPPMQHSQQNPDNLRPASSVYSQPSPGSMNDQFPYNTYAKPMTPNSVEVSPPSSPEFDATRRNANRYQDHEVSPIDEVPDISHLGFGNSRERTDARLNPPASSIPVIRKEKRRNHVAAAAANLLNRKDIDGPKGWKPADVRSDPYSGEQTTSERGKPQPIKPGEYSPPDLRNVRQMGNTSIISAGASVQKPPNAPSFSERVRKLKNNAPVEKPEWKGATGRSAIVPTPSDNYSIPPLKIPIPSNNEKRITSGTNTPVSSIRSTNSETQAASTFMDLPSPLSIDAGHSLSGRNSPQSYNEPSIQNPEPVHAAHLANFATNITTELPTTEFSIEYYPSHSKQDSTGTIERNFREALKNSFPPIDLNEPYVQPPSRFSVSTRATSEATQSTRAPSLDLQNDMHPPLPIQSYNMTTQAPTSILSRKRPKVGADDSTSMYSNKSITRKAINSNSPITISMTSSIPREHNHPQNSSSTLTKSLPSTPAETASSDPISNLKARLETLTHRRQNIEKLIKQMTELMPADRMIAADEVKRKREMEKKQIEALREEEAEIRREEHECGLKLHRAWKRKDKQAGYEGTGLWVRRVTG
ncbi:e4719eb3-b351-4dc1-b18d-a8484d12ebd6 [Sclerotinia trifoliorum]|uniref:E4719eb3-b351-4dc1-b18d-a8484d12ebd6 n=1 Tax=Sclerotinia trifoliorum TaxID=28548 RepID=A0A8H2VYS3_9HELO|nr:e4719eb3-b351-4dc1-b18d-a8484d12ebd6 [Sclerotinia trifoliorum]